MAFVAKLTAYCQTKCAKEAAFIFVWTPHLHALIFAARGDTPAVRRPCYGQHFFGVAAINKDKSAVRCIPHLNAFVIACRGDTFAIGGPCHGADCIAMTAIDEHLFPSCSVSFFMLVPFAPCPAEEARIFKIASDGGALQRAGNASWRHFLITKKTG